MKTPSLSDGATAHLQFFNQRSEYLTIPRVWKLLLRRRIQELAFMPKSCTVRVTAAMKLLTAPVVQPRYSRGLRLTSGKVFLSSGLPLSRVCLKLHFHFTLLPKSLQALCSSSIDIALAFEKMCLRLKAPSNNTTGHGIRCSGSALNAVKSSSTTYVR